MLESKAISNHKVKICKKDGPTSFTMIWYAGGYEILEVAMIGVDNDLILCTLNVVMPYLTSIYNGQEFLIVDFVVDLLESVLLEIKRLLHEKLHLVYIEIR